MLKEMILINSAEFDYARIDLSKDIFFAGDNGTGKTSTIIALFYLFSGDNNSRKLGISSDKKSFKEYYFPDERNSFLIYIFDDFFIFMYKQNGEIFKRFSKKDFEIEKIVQDNGTLHPFKTIQEYLKDAPLTYLSKSSGYREVIYGQNRQYLDFKITNIKNYNVFVELFNQTFNVDKSIVDTNSIKRAIQKSLNMEEKNIEFDYQKYMEEIRSFQESYLFFRKFEKEHQRIDQAFVLQEQLLKLEKEKESLQAQMAYRKEIEAPLLTQKEERLQRLEQQAQEHQAKKIQKENSLNRMRERFAKKIATLEKEIEDIKALKIKFAPEQYKVQQEQFLKLPFLEKELLQKQQQLTLLEADVLNALNTIDQEILELRSRRNHDLPREKQLKKEQLKAQTRELLAQKKEEQRNQKEHTQHRMEGEIATIRLNIEEQELELEAQKSQANALNQDYRDKLNLFLEEQFKAKKSYQNEIETLEEQVRHNKRAIKELSHQEEQRKQLTQTLRKKLTQSLWQERQYLNQTIATQKSILHTPKGSFKEFLQQSGLSWEKELYPFMDASLLSMSTQELKPELINADIPLGIKFNSKALKSIPTQEESEESIREARLKKAHLRQLYLEEKQALFTQESQELERLKHEIKMLQTEEKNLKEKLEKLRQNISKINTIAIPEYEKELNQEKDKKLEDINQKIEQIKSKIHVQKEQIVALKKAFDTFLKEQLQELKAYQKSLEEQEEKEKKYLKKWLQNEQEKLDKKIEELQNNRKKLSKDELVDELKSAIEKLKKSLQKAQDAKYYLEEYEARRSFIESLSQKESRLLMAKQNRENLERQLLFKEQSIIKAFNSTQEAIKQIKEEIQHLQEGLEKSKNLNLETPSQTQETQRYLLELIESYQELKRSYKGAKTDLKELLSQLNTLKNNPIKEIGFKIENFSKFEQLGDDLETLEQLQELRDFKSKQFEPLKRTTNEKYFNFIKSEIPSKLGSLSHSEDKFQEQVRKINKNLSTIDFSIVRNIKIKSEVGNQRSVMSLLGEMNTLVQNLSITDQSNSLFFDRPQTNQDLQKIANLLSEIKNTLKGGAITLLDTIDLSLEFTENGTTKSNVTQIKNESSTGGTILLKMALAVSILGLYTQEKKSTFFLILDEVSRLHSHNQDLLRHFANSRGFRIVFVTPEPVYAKPDEIKYYKFMRRVDNRFEIIGLNA
jgi:DNA repair exonuclease SbcCD ATPase subunit